MSNISFINSCSRIEFITFSDGTETCKIIQSHLGSLTHIQADIIDGTRDLIRIGLVKDALDRMGVEDIELTLGYFPQARADRVFETGNPLPVKVFADILNSFNFNKVYIYDPHSDVTPALINNVKIIDQVNCFRMVKPTVDQYLPEYTICAPDLGATKKTFDIVKDLGKDTYIQAIKVRDVTTGQIVKCDLVEEEVSGDVLIVDDICDYGGSFCFLADKLREKGATKVGLYVTHAILKDGLGKLEKHIDYIFINNIVGENINWEDIRRFNER